MIFAMNFKIKDNELISNHSILILLTLSIDDGIDCLVVVFPLLYNIKSKISTIQGLNKRFKEVKEGQT